MIGSLITKGLVLMFGYAYPAYECYKTVELNKPEIEQLRFWCQYWILVAMLTVCERVGDMFIGWIPMYGEAKLAFFIYLWFPKTRGTTYVYDSFFRPYVAKHETDIDRNLIEIRTRVGDVAIMYWQKAASYAQTRVYEILQYIASQSSTTQPAQTQAQTDILQKSTATPTRTLSATTRPQNEQPSSPSTASSSIESSQDAADSSEEAGPSSNSKQASATLTINEQKTTMALTILGRSKSEDSTEEQVMQVTTEPSVESQNSQPLAFDTVMEEAKCVTRVRSRRTRGAATSG